MSLSSSVSDRDRALSRRDSAVAIAVHVAREARSVPSRGGFDRVM
jgi:hypothetical protein